ncbi:hypothetical protein HYU19_03590 [Candidatus Woesearchaeota archaeon]|nr:hypothetical protein [Candidatus Woesearchaeota archaeon]
MKKLLHTRLRFLGRNLQKADKLPEEEWLHVVEVVRDHEHAGSMMVDRTMLHLLYSLKKEYRSFTLAVSPVLDEYTTLVEVMKQKSNCSQDILEKYTTSLAKLRLHQPMAEALVQQMTYLKKYIELHQYFTAKMFTEECKVAFGRIQREFTKAYQPVLNLKGLK